MKIVYCIFVAVLQLPLELHCAENNVCETIQDYYAIKYNKNCEYDVAADPDSDPTTIIEFYGYLAETHTVTTIDGYKLTMYRVQNNEVASKKDPVFLQHGIMGTAAAFLALGKNSLAFILADAGYDVWLGNFRGTTYSEGHVNLTVYNEQYWDYSGNEIALYDIPAQLYYVSYATGNQGNILYIGHSFGSTANLAYTSTYPEESRKLIKLSILLSPIAHTPNPKPPIFKFLGPYFKPLLKIITNFKLLRFVSQSKPLQSVIRYFCLQSPLHMEGCYFLINIILAGLHHQVDPKTLPVSFAQFPGGSSFKLFVHAADVFMGNFRRYDYGYDNFKIYGSYEPPPFELSRIEVPVFLIYAAGDWVASSENARNLYNNLSPRVRYGKYEIKIPNFNHYDFIYGRNAKSLVYDPVLQILDSIEQNIEL